MATLTASDRDARRSLEERRTEPRDAINVRARLKSLDPLTSTGPSTVVRVMEISRHGLKIFTQRLVLPNSLVQVTMFHEVITGRVRHCTAVAIGFHVGIERAKLCL